MSTIRISLSVAEMNVMLECVSSGMEWAEGQIRDETIDVEVRKNLVEKSVILGQIGLKLIGKAGPYMTDDDPEIRASRDSGGAT